MSKLTRQQVEEFRKEYMIQCDLPGAAPWAEEENRILNEMCDGYQPDHDPLLWNVLGVMSHSEAISKIGDMKARLVLQAARIQQLEKDLEQARIAWAGVRQVMRDHGQ